MKKDPKHHKTPSFSRRTGIDRRWVRTPEFHPERRLGGDRRTPPRCREFFPPLPHLDSEPQTEWAMYQAESDPVEEMAISEITPKNETTPAESSADLTHQQSELFYLMFNHMRF